MLDVLLRLRAGKHVLRRQISGLPDNPPVRLHVIDQRKDRHQPDGTPAVLHLHGGGYVMGSPAMQSDRLKQLSARLNCLVVSVDYRLAPESPFPGALDDSYAALSWIHLSAKSLGVDPSRIAVIGDSTGGAPAFTESWTSALIRAFRSIT